VIKPSIETLKEEFEDAIPPQNWVAVNTHADTNGYVAKYEVAVVPTLVVVKNGVEVGRHSGSTISLYYTLIRKALRA
jgi:hypothetical protein